VERRTGIEEYSYQIIKHLRDKLGDCEVRLYLKKAQKIDFEIPSNWKLKTIKFPYLWTQFGLSLEMLLHPLDVLFIPAHVVPIFHAKKTIVVVHGLEFEFIPKAYSFWARMYMRWSIKSSCRWAKKIIAVSENTKKDLVRLYKVPEGKIEVIYEGIEPIRNYELNSNLRTMLNTKCLLFIGRLEERKNITGIIKAFDILKEKYKIPHKLILAGKPGYGYENIKEKIENSEYKNNIILAGYVGEEEKQELLKNAEVFLFPTFYEGFGLPILEAEALGVPVVASNNSSIPEVLGNSAILVNPKKPEEIAEAVWKILSDENLRDNLIRKGLENVKRFDWEKCAEKIVKILK
jgi:glycosyltransferase involved in cell wall biosynthesis